MKTLSYFKVGIHQYLGRLRALPRRSGLRVPSGKPTMGRRTDVPSLRFAPHNTAAERAAASLQLPLQRHGQDSFAGQQEYRVVRKEARSGSDVGTLPARSST